MATNRRSFHSDDFRLDTIDGKTQRQWESVWKVGGDIQRLRSLGWDRYQWQHTDFADCNSDAGVSGGLMISGPCYAEFFGSCYHGYLLGGGSTVAEAINKCLDKAQEIVNLKSSLIREVQMCADWVRHIGQTEKTHQESLAEAVAKIFTGHGKVT